MRNEVLNSQGASRGYKFRVLASKVHFTAQDETKKDKGEKEEKKKKDQRKQKMSRSSCSMSDSVSVGEY